jgi:histone H3/H4
MARTKTTLAKKPTDRKKPLVVFDSKLSDDKPEPRKRRHKTRGSRNGMTGTGMKSGIRALSILLAKQWAANQTKSNPAGEPVSAPSGFMNDAIAALDEAANMYLEVYATSAGMFARKAGRVNVTDKHVKSALRTRYIGAAELLDVTLEEIDASLDNLVAFKENDMGKDKKTPMNKKIRSVLRPPQAEKVLRRYVCHGQTVSPKAVVAITVALECFLGDWIDAARALAIHDGNTSRISGRHVSKAIANDGELRGVIDSSRNAIFGHGMKGSRA